MKVKAYLGLGSRYSYLASTQLDRIAESCGIEFDWIPINSVDLIRRARTDGSPCDQPILAGQYDPKFRERDAKRWAVHYHVAFNEPDLSSLPSNALALTCWCLPDPDLRQKLIKDIFNAIFSESATMTMNSLELVARNYDVSPAEIADGLNGGEAASLHELAIQNALKDGAFGVPTFVADGELFWGNDRLPLLETYLEAL
ncbi:DsbA family protein [Ruegeria sp.]|uniref:DsbA family protein n=1 Tax=Ruegeria sp. TaxID=1879320 RepID=UPI003C7DFAD5